MTTMTQKVIFAAKDEGIWVDGYARGPRDTREGISNVLQLLPLDHRKEFGITKLVLTITLGKELPDPEDKEIREALGVLQEFTGPGLQWRLHTMTSATGAAYPQLVLERI